MDPVILIVVPGLIGGLAIALFIALQRTRPSKRPPDAFGQDPSTDVINMARIRVAGVGGLGLVAMAAVVAWFVPRIGQTLMFGFVLGIMLAAFLILRRRGAGPMPSSGRRVGANTMLSIDQPATSKGDDNRRAPDRSLRSPEPVRHAP